MTNKPMLSVEREVIEKALRDALTIRFDTDSQVTKLRALLDKPAQPVPECVGDLERFEADDGVFVRLGDVIDMLGNEKAAKHQVEPVTDDQLIETARKAALNSTHRYSYMPATQEDASSWLPHRWVVEAMRDAVSAEQPVLAAVAMPERKTKADYSGYIEQFQPEAAAIYNSALDDVTRLNGVKP